MTEVTGLSSRQRLSSPNQAHRFGSATRPMAASSCEQQQLAACIHLTLVPEAVRCGGAVVMFGRGRSCGDGQGAAAAFKELGLGAVSCSGFLHHRNRESAESERVRVSERV